MAEPAAPVAVLPAVSLNDLVEAAFARLRQSPGFTDRPDQAQLAFLISDMIGGGGRGLFEAPTGLGKSLATLIPAIANALALGKRTAVATYTNVLAEQYWRKDLPLALSLFEGKPTTAFLIGRSRFVCLLQMEEAMPRRVEEFRAKAQLGTESEFREIFPLDRGEAIEAWRQVMVPPVCPARACPLYDECYYYRARREAEAAHIVVTNHSVVISHALSRNVEADRAGILGPLDHIILDEAHDFPSAAINGLEVELTASKVVTAQALAGRIARWSNLPQVEARRARFERDVDRAFEEIRVVAHEYDRPILVAANPSELKEHPAVQSLFVEEAAKRLGPPTHAIEEACFAFTAYTERAISELAMTSPARAREAADATRNLIAFLRDFGGGMAGLFAEGDASATHLTPAGGFANRDGPVLRRDLLDLAPTLREILWDPIPATCLSATLVLDGEFAHFKRATGFTADFEEALPSPFDWEHQGAIYLPPAGTIPDPTTAREPGMEAAYYAAVAQELSRLIALAGGRTLALFHSRKEMEEVARRVRLPEGLPILLQPKGGIASVGREFREKISSSLFALRSFWTGFDAPGETLSVVALVRVPFEVPTEPAQIARLVYLSQQGFDPFRDGSLAGAKMLIRQGAGRSIRTPEDKAVIALLDPRLRTKRYGEEIIANLPAGMRTFDDPADALGFLEIA